MCGNGPRGQGPGAADGPGAASLPEPPAPDHAADALAVAICHANGAPLPRAALSASHDRAARSGEVAVRRADHVVVSAGGVGYRLRVSAETLRARAPRWASEARSTPT